jgi:hypothetical protein
MTNPWTTGNINPVILQRFGTPSKHKFGVSSSVTWTGVHNVHYNVDSTGTVETLSVFVNGQSGSSFAWVYEFDVLKVFPTATTIANDTVFATNYRAYPTVLPTFTSHGGARPIGNIIGSEVWLDTSLTGLSCVDTVGSFRVKTLLQLYQIHLECIMIHLLM